MTRLVAPLAVVTIVMHAAPACAPPAAEAPAAADPGAASAATRWAPVVAAGDATLLSAPARLVAPAGASGVVAPPVAARVEAVHVEVGQTVAAGDALVTLAVPELLRAAADRAAASRLAAVYARRARALAGLRGEGLARTGELFEVEARAAEARAEVARAEGVLRAAGVDPAAAEGLEAAPALVLRSPVAGVVVAVDATLGSFRHPEDGPLVEVRGVARVRVEARLAHLPPPGTVVRFVEPDGVGHPLAPTPVAAVPGAADGVLVAWFEPDPPLVRPHGLPGRLEVSAPAGTLLQVPSRAVLVEGGRAWVLRDEEGRTARVPVEVVAASGAATLVRGALAVGDRVASDASLVAADAGGGA